MLKVVIGNIGTVYEGLSIKQAEKTYYEYVKQSMKYHGRAAGEGVVLIKNGEIELETYSRYLD